MSVLDDAIALEERANKYYKGAQAQIHDPSARKILELLAAEEKKHAAVLNAMKGGEYDGLEAPSLFEEVRGLVEGAVSEGRSSILTDASMRDVLQQAMEIEQATQRFYREHFEQADNEALRKLFEHLADQEAEHYLLVSSLAEYFDRPVEWVESAEFGLRPEY